MQTPIHPFPIRLKGMLIALVLTAISVVGCGDDPGPTGTPDVRVAPPTAHLGSIQIDSADFYDPDWWANPPAGIFEIEQVVINQIFLGSLGTGNFHAGVTVEHTMGAIMGGVVEWLAGIRANGWAHMTISAPGFSSNSIDTGGPSFGGSYYRPIEFPFGCEAFDGLMGLAEAAGVVEWSHVALPFYFATVTRGPEPSGAEEIDLCLNEDPPPGGGGEGPPEGEYYCMWEEWGLFAYIDGDWVLVDSWWEESYCWFEEASQ